ncbi:MAG: nucleoside kinase [Candidatus Cloacimonetes bacterium]|nr:nucleoside kinase [Candidatus Cloacimonadota bacterium]
MIKITLKKNNEVFKHIAYAGKMKVKEIIEDQDLKNCHIVAFLMNKKYVGSNTEITKNCEINILTSDTSEGHRIYQDTTIFILMKAFHNIFPENSKILVEHSISDGVFCHTNYDEYFTQDIMNKIKTEMRRIIDAALPIEKVELDIKEAEKIFVRLNRTDLLKNMHYREMRTMTLFKCSEFFDYYIRQLADNTSFIKDFDLVWHNPGFILRFPRRGHCKVDKDFSIPEKLFGVHKEYINWLDILKIDDITDLNKAIKKFQINELIQVEEALQEKQIAGIADLIKSKATTKIVLIAGPSSSGKTTFAKRLSIQMRVNGLIPLVIGLDDYFLPRNFSPRLPNGDYDFESIKALDLELLNLHLKQLLNGEEVTVPRYNFLTGNREEGEHKIRLQKNNIIVMEGIHGINEELTKEIAKEFKFKIYISALNQVNIDDHNRVPTTDVRKIRRIIRDKNYRGYSAEQTLLRWPAVRLGEDKNIFPFQEEADFMFNSGLTYELGVMKVFVEEYLREVPENSPVYIEANRLLELLTHFKSIRSDFVPSNSIIREFIGGSVFKY